MAARGTPGPPASAPATCGGRILAEVVETESGKQNRWRRIALPAVVGLQGWFIRSRRPRFTCSLSRDVCRLRSRGRRICIVTWQVGTLTAAGRGVPSGRWITEATPGLVTAADFRAGNGRAGISLIPRRREPPSRPRSPHPQTPNQNRLVSAVILLVISCVFSNAWPSKCSTDFSVSIRILSNATIPRVRSGSECGGRR
jgi:hypothetical protein